APFNYDVILCNPSLESQDNPDNGPHRDSVDQCVLPTILYDSLIKLNPNISKEKIQETVKNLSKNFTDKDIVETNYKLYQMIREKIKITEKRNGKEEFDFINLIDFENPENNNFTAVSQMWIKGSFGYCRPDVLIFVNGLPLVFIELKNETVKIQEAFTKNLTDYKKIIPNIFAFNQICVLSNGRETRIGAFNADYEFFFQWLKPTTEKEKINRKQIFEDGISLEIFADGLLRKETLLDYIENFILFDNQKTKIIAKNHQFLGVNNLFRQMYKREELKGKLGVFWHTQGSGKSYSMVMFARKVMRKIVGNFSFLVVTDRDDLDTQIHKTFVRTDVIKQSEIVQPANSEKLREYLGTNQKFVFTLIHKFRYDKKKEYPLLSTRNDIIVMVDEAHRTQYADLAENMRKGLPNANFVAFTGTPLLGTQKLTNQWFGDYVSEYNFAQAIEDGSTVPLFYSRRVPEVGLQNNFLDDDIVKIVEEEKLNDREEEALENAKSKIIEVLDRDDRLEKVAQDIAHHFPRRGFLGKAMVVSVTKYTAVKMYDKVQKYWKIEIQNLYNERNTIDPNDKEKLQKINEMIDYMEKTEMAVIISEEADEEEKFKKKGLSVKQHRDLMNAVDKDGNDIEDRFKNAHDPLRLVFVCAMWLTGFDVPSLSTLYLDKPMKSHTLMQAIARANRVYPDKTAGIIVDYVNVFKYMNDALAEY
ncbi:MAG: type I restriction endonuclease subunit R, partial [Spirochaetaceae bacterium]|nr:type I restriction endonuclease subunit R [Spirochaetaceae bacterium]